MCLTAIAKSCSILPMDGRVHHTVAGFSVGLSVGSEREVPGRRDRGPMGKTSLTELLVLGLFVLGLEACSPAAANENPGVNRSLAQRTAQRTLVAGTLIQVTTQGFLSYRRNKAGETLTALVSGDVEDDRGQVVIPAGSRVALRITQLTPATDPSLTGGKIALVVTSLTVRGQEYPLRIRVEPPHLLQGRSVTSGEVEQPGGDGTAILFVLPQTLTVATPQGAMPRW